MVGMSVLLHTSNTLEAVTSEIVAFSRDTEKPVEYS